MAKASATASSRRTRAKSCNGWCTRGRRRDCPCVWWRVAAGLRGEPRWATHADAVDGALRNAMNASPGMWRCFSCLRHAALTEDHQLLFVLPGSMLPVPWRTRRHVVVERSGHHDLSAPFDDFRASRSRVRPSEARIGRVRICVSLDAGAGRGGNLLAGSVRPRRRRHRSAASLSEGRRRPAGKHFPARSQLKLRCRRRRPVDRYR